MKKTLTLVLAALMMLTLSIGASATRDLHYQAPYAVPTIDGVIDDAWNFAEWTQIDLDYTTGDPSVCTARAKIMHDDALIYFLIEVTDATIGSDQDFLEFYLDEKNEKDAYSETCYQLRMGIDSTTNILDGNNNPESRIENVKQYAIGTSENGYVLEIAFQPAEVAPAAGVTMGLEFMYNDSDAEGTFLWALRWNVDTANGDTAPWQSAECFGDLEFLAKVEEEVVEEEVVEEAPADTIADAPVTAPTTADAGIIAAVAVMAVAAGVVLSKKH